MRFRGLDLNLLVALDALLSERSVTRASERIHIGQPGMSSALMRLRSFFDDELLIPVGRAMVPTPLALSLVDPLKTILGEIDNQILSRPVFHPGNACRNFVFLISDYVKSILMPTFLSNVQELAPNITFELVSIAGQCSLELDRCSADVVIIPDALASHAHPKECLFTDRFVVIAQSGNDALSHGMTPELYMEMGHVLPRFGPGQAPGIEELYFQKFGQLRKGEVIVPDFGMIPEMVATSSRIATLPLRMAQLAAMRHPVTIFELPFPMTATQAVMQWNSAKTSEPGTQWLLQMLRDSAAQVFAEPEKTRREAPPYRHNRRIGDMQLH